MVNSPIKELAKIIYIAILPFRVQNSTFCYFLSWMETNLSRMWVFSLFQEKMQIVPSYNIVIKKIYNE